MEDSAGKQQQTNKETKNVDSVGKNQQTNKETKHVVMIKKTCLWLNGGWWCICILFVYLIVFFLSSFCSHVK